MTIPTYKPTHPDLFVVAFGNEGEFRSSLKAVKAFEKDEILCHITGTTKAKIAYTSVQTGKGPDDHIELNSDLVYANHSCEPSTEWNLSSKNSDEWTVRALKKIEVGDDITFFYPCTEWDMTQPFECFCGAPSCLGKVRGAKYLDLADMQKRCYINPWIIELAEERGPVKSTS
ncbi:hypothetical protein C8Q75DRAFT_767942 [Abortiporus biennis]|nr:hypothetical protein C8Q75DRAFT_767942 [Abortiporus biennis]